MASARPDSLGNLRYRLLTGVGGIGTGIFFQLEGDRDLGRNESRPGTLLPIQDYCKLHIIAHYVAVLLGADRGRFHVLPIGKVGDDQQAEGLRKEMQEAGMDLQYVRTVPDRPTLMSVCFQYPDGAGGNITTSESAASLLTTQDVDEAEPEIAAAAGECIALAAPEVPLEIRHHLLTLGGKHRALRVAALTSAEVEQAFRLGIFKHIDLLSINEDEGAAIVGSPFEDGAADAFLDALAEKLTDEQRDMKVVFSVGPRGTYAYEDGNWGFCPAAKVQIAGTAGAGDALLSGIMVGLTAGWPLVCPGPKRSSITETPLSSALDLAVLLAAFTVTSGHTIHPDADGPALVQFADRLGVELSDEVMQLLIR